MEQKASALSNIMQETLIKQLIADYFDEVVLIETATGRVLNISDSISCQKHTYRWPLCGRICRPPSARLCKRLFV